MSRDMYGAPLTPGVNVDRVNIDVAATYAATLGYDDPNAQAVVIYALQRWERGEESGAVATWTSHYPHDLTSWLMILATALAHAHVPKHLKEAAR